MINTEKMKMRIKGHGLTQSKIAEFIGMSDALLSMKIRNKRAMTLSEAEAIARVLNIGDREFSEYFLVNFCCKKQRKFTKF